MERLKKQLRFRAVFSISRHCSEIESLAAPMARRGPSIARKDESPSEGPKNRFQGQKTACASSGIRGGQERINFMDGRFRPKSAKIRMQFPVKEKP